MLTSSFSFPLDLEEPTTLYKCWNAVADTVNDLALDYKFPVSLPWSLKIRKMTHSAMMAPGCFNDAWLKQLRSDNFTHVAVLELRTGRMKHEGWVLFVQTVYHKWLKILGDWVKTDALKPMSEFEASQLAEKLIRPHWATQWRFLPLVETPSVLRARSPSIHRRTLGSSADKPADQGQLRGQGKDAQSEPIISVSTAAWLRRLYGPKWDIFNSLRKQLDPNSLFLNASFRKILTPYPSELEEAAAELGAPLRFGADFDDQKDDVEGTDTNSVLVHIEKTRPAHAYA